MFLLHITAASHTTNHPNEILFINRSIEHADKTFVDIKGKITDDGGEPLSGVSIVEKGTNNGTFSKPDGTFSINVSKADAILVISYVSFKTVEIAASRAGLENIVLETDGGNMEDIVVVGYGTRKRDDVGGAVVAVDNRVLKDRPVTNTMAALQGAAPGLVITRSSGQPGQENWTARIRGITSLGTQNAPLVIIDGVEGSLNDLNPNDIDQISVLEDAASASIYGAKAGGGVILVTTKGGKMNQKPKVDLLSLYTFRTPYARPGLISSRRQADLENVARFNTSGTLAFTDEQLAMFDNPNINEYWNQAVGNGAGAWEYYYNHNLADILMRDQSPQRNVNLSVSGGGAKSSYLFSVGYLDQEGVFRFGPDSYNKFNARLNYNTRFSDIFSFDARVSFVKDNTLAPSVPITGDGSGLMYNIYSIRSARNPIFAPGTTDRYAFIGTLSSAYPILKDGGYNDYERYNTNGVFTLSAKQLVRGLDLRVVYSPGVVLGNREIFNRTIQRWGIDRDKNLIPGTPLNAVNNVEKGREQTITQNFFATADYNLDIGNHNFHLLGGYEFKTYRFDRTTAIQRALLLNDFPTLNYTTLANANVNNVGDNIQTNVWVSYFGRLSYNYNKRYYFEGTARRDGSSRLAPGYKFQNFYSGLAFWRVSQEEWFKNSVSWMDELKISASYGSLGGAQTADPNVNNYDFQAFLSSGYYPFNDARTAFLFQSGLPADGKAWEVIKTMDVGVKMEFLQRRLGVDFNYFVKKNNNVFTSQNLPAILGVTPNEANLAAIQVKGWGVMLSWRDQFRNGSYFVTANLSDDINKVTAFNGVPSYNLGINPVLLGQSTSSIYGFQSDGYFNTEAELAGSPVRVNDTKVGDIKLVDVNKDGAINMGNQTAENHGDLVYLGNTNSRYVFGLNGGFSWKGFDFSFIVNGVGKRNLVLQPFASIAFYDGWRLPWAIHEDYWTPENTDAKFPRLMFGDRINTVVSSHWVQDASYVRLKNVQLGYTLNKATHKLRFLNDVRLYVNGQDLWEKTGMWYNYYDPENTENVGFSYPLWRSFSIGLNLSF